MLGVASLGKRSHEQCEYQCDGACTIYESRPDDCRTWQCAWLTDRLFERPMLYERERPDRIGAILDIDRQYRILVRECWPRAAQTQQVLAVIERLARHNTVIVVKHGTNEAVKMP